MRGARMLTEVESCGSRVHVLRYACDLFIECIHKYFNLKTLTKKEL